ncbi:M23 family metallopeptidase [Oscillibacter sp.]|uniref:M23 family metallopeptidase n=1 Tax=Oscillibacter sp. TaxID=1945593 RepID=UPI00263722B9|nr:M23 family metallopeptidase [Oscillibacter sp.]MDD3347034.1 M23 family metallopeptidase [Oscillibacter sp.]
MKNKLKTLLGNGGFYAALVACVLAVGIGGYYLLLDRDGTNPASEIPTQAEVTAPAPELQETEEPAVVETIQPTPVAEEPPSMPEEEIDSTPVVAEAPRLIVSPLKGDVLTAFSVDQLVYSETLNDWRTHDGLDISARAGTTVLAACSGTVSGITDDALMGTTVVIDHAGGYQTTYASLQTTPNVEVGDAVSAGQIVGAVGTTAAAESAQGPHLHFSVTKDGDAVDPDEFLKR